MNEVIIEKKTNNPELDLMVFDSDALKSKYLQKVSVNMFCFLINCTQLL